MMTDTGPDHQRSTQYEELVLLQELMVLVDQTDVIDHPLLIEDRETFESLYNKGNERMTAEECLQTRCSLLAW